MAILSNGKFYGFLCSVKETGRQLANGVKEYVEDFVSGFAGHGWRLWEYMTNKWKLEIDTIVVRETMLVFEMLISKVRAIIGAQTISQGHGKVKAVSISDDGTEYLIVLEDEDVSIVAHDFVRCQTFVGNKTKLYHVEVDSIDVETKTLHVPLTEFDKDESGNVLYPPVSGDELVQFGNSQNKARQSAIYLHADETGQPAIDVMFDIDSKNWDNKVKVRMGGDIPGGNGLKGFYCVNGMMKCVDDKGAVVYEFAPNGTVNIGKGNIVYDPATNKVTLGSGVTLTWNNLDSESKENLKGEPGKDGQDGANGQDGQDGKDGIDIVWKGDSSIPPVNPQKNWAYRDTDNGRVYIYNGTVWALMVADGNDGIDGTDGEPGADGKDGMRVYITYHDSEEEPVKPVGDGTTNGWHTNSTASVIWISQKVAESATSGVWGNPIRIKGETGKDANLLPWVEDWDNNKTQIGSEHVISPKMFAGTNTGTLSNPILTGVAIGRGVITVNGIERTGLFGLKNGQLTFEIDAETGDAIFRGKVETQSSGKKIIIDPDTNTFEMRDSNGESVFTLEFFEFNGYSVPRIRLIDTTEVPGTNFHSSASLSNNSINLVDYEGYTPSSVGVNISSSISKLGIWFHKSGDGFILNVDSKVSDVSINGVTYHRHLTRWSPGYLPNESQANRGEIYANSDGILRIKY